jgi:hypothetical protein
MLHLSASLFITTIQNLMHSKLSCQQRTQKVYANLNSSACEDTKDMNLE